MKHITILLTALLLSLCLPGSGSAHKVNVFAYADGDAIQVEAYFTRSQKVRQGNVSVSDLATGETLLQGTTDDMGLFRFRPDQAFLDTGRGLTVLLDAGEGHQSTWEITPEELASLSPSGASAATGPSGQPEQPGSGHAPLTVAAAPSAAPGDGPAASGAGVSNEELAALVGTMLDVKLAPIKQALARQEDSGPGLRDIVGGLGWILGLLGLAAYLKYRP